MFGLEIAFQDGVSDPEMILVRRPQALIGASDYAHVVVEDMAKLHYQLRIVRELGNRFRVLPVGTQERSGAPDAANRSYDGTAEIDLGPVRLNILALDTDLTVKEGEPPDRAGVRIVRRACAVAAPRYPAVVVRGTQPMIISFGEDLPIYIGRSKQCALRLESAEISARHARMGFEAGEFWVEDLGSTNGTFVNNQQISGRVSVSPGSPIVLGREISIVGALNNEHISEISLTPSNAAVAPVTKAEAFPILISNSEIARPMRLILPRSGTVTMGRDPTSDIWLGAPHISRKHAAVSVSSTGVVSVSDHSTNGTIVNGQILNKGDVLGVNGTSTVLDFGGGVTVCLCFDTEQEREFTSGVTGSRQFTNNDIEQTSGTSPLITNQTRTRLTGTHRAVRGAPTSIFGRIVSVFLMPYRSSGIFGRSAIVFAFLALGMFVLAVGILLLNYFR